MPIFFKYLFLFQVKIILFSTFLAFFGINSPLFLLAKMAFDSGMGKEDIMMLQACFNDQC